MDRDQKIYREAAALWQELFGEAPPARADSGALLDLITRNLPEANYERLRTPYLRPATITMPARPGSDGR